MGASSQIAPIFHKLFVYLYRQITIYKENYERLIKYYS